MVAEWNREILGRGSSNDRRLLLSEKTFFGSNRFCPRPVSCARRSGGMNGLASIRFQVNLSVQSLTVDALEQV